MYLLLAVHPATDKPVWWLFGATVFLAAAAWFALGQLREVKKDRHIQVMSDFGRRWDEPHLWEARERQVEISDEELALLVERWFTKGDPEAKEVQLLLRVPNFFEDLALTVEIGSMELRTVDLWLGSVIDRMWNYWSPAITKMRESRPTSYAQFERLVLDLRANKPLG